MRSVAYVTVAVLLLAGLPLGASRSVLIITPDDCTPVDARLWYAYQYDALTRRAWQAYGVASAGVCEMAAGSPATTPPCDFLARAPRLTQGGLTSGDLCWYGAEPSSVPPAPPEPTAPAACLATDMTTRSQYRESDLTQQRWDNWAEMTQGVCVAVGSLPPECGFIMQEGPDRWLCWWPNPHRSSHPGAFKRASTADSYRTLVETALGVPEVCDFVGSGRFKLEVEVDPKNVRFLIQGCRIQDMHYLTEPGGCFKALPRTVAVTASASATTGANAKKAAGFDRDDYQGICMRMGVPREGECTHMQQGGSLSYICAWGLTKEGFADLHPAYVDVPTYRIQLDAKALMSLVNNEDLGNTANALLGQGYLVINADDPGKQAQINVALSDLAGDLIQFEPFRPDDFSQWNGQAADPVGRGTGGVTGAVTPGAVVFIDDMGSPVASASDALTRYTPEAIYDTADMIPTHGDPPRLSDDRVFDTDRVVGPLSQPPNVIRDVVRRDAAGWFGAIGPGGRPPAEPEVITFVDAFTTVRDTEEIVIQDWWRAPADEEGIEDPEAAPDRDGDGQAGPAPAPRVDPVLESDVAAAGGGGDNPLLTTLWEPTPNADPTQPPVFVGPGGPAGAPVGGPAAPSGPAAAWGTTSLVDLKTCRRACNLAPDGDVLNTTEGRAYLAGMLAAMRSRERLQGAGLVEDA